MSRLTRRFGRAPEELLSVIVPMYNVEEYVAGSLRSILTQPVRNLEVIVVDDGSTDRSADVAAAVAAKDPRVRLLRQANTGVSGARNAALAACRGDLITFVDPDDELPADAWSAMLRTLRQTGSDFAVGSMARVAEDGERSIPPLLERNHAQANLVIRIHDQPLMLADVFPCNKIFRADFWRKNALSFPVGLSYEDQVLMTEAFLKARSFDVLTEVVYEWRIRGDLSSATQRRGQLSNLCDRVVTKRITADQVRDASDPALLDVLFREILPIDMWEHFRAAVDPATQDADDYWAMLRACVLEFWNEATVPFEATVLPPGQRLMGWLVAQDRRADLAHLIATIDGPGVPIEDGRYLHPWCDEPAVPASLAMAVAPGP
jgi:CDP-glycerol glycerophosphotransferase